MTSQQNDVPERIGRYEVLSLIGRGGYARVYKARLVGTSGGNRIVAIKVTAAPESEDDKQVRALINEARICSRIQHPNIIEVFEFGRVERQVFIAMEYADGVPLDVAIQHRARRGARLDPGFAVEVLRQVCSGLRHAHRFVDDDGTEHTVIHRDLKPGNLMLTRSGLVKIMDFGIAKSALSLTQTMEGFTKGTPMYMSPEQVQGVPLTPASDIYSLGIVLFELLTGHRLFAAKNLMQIIEKVALSDIEPDLALHARDIGMLMPLLRRMLDASPAARYDDAGALLAALDAVREDVPPGPTVAQIVAEVSGNAPGASDAVEPRAAPPGPPPAPAPRAGASGSWSVVMPAISREIGLGDAGDRPVTLSLELDLDDPDPA